jgi:hypothetical protein
MRIRCAHRNWARNYIATGRWQALKNCRVIPKVTMTIYFLSEENINRSLQLLRRFGLFFPVAVSAFIFSDQIRSLNLWHTAGQATAGLYVKVAGHRLRVAVRLRI